ncbi:dihydroxyacetone kinase subunit L [Pelagibius sp. Alg239-R121]|uniref:dihydroxyacetone kinase subunit L n=1 Tax=Pelagibius sp. Alg239-R121 TaxID=2993448 RepID=UPI0024A750F9|nr:dihydroxyacetone kinase subunit L [Pelagibius sp. Alg239-R121]
MTGISRAHLQIALERLAAAGASAHDELNAQDGKLGDGDLGITVARGWREAADGATELPDDVGMAFLACSKAFQRVSSSSFGTLIATGLMSAAKACKGRSDIPFSESSALLEGAIEAMLKRGKGALGDKTVIDMLEEIRLATAGKADPQEILTATDAAATKALERFRDQPSKLGRARMFGEKSIGLDDPGMLALRRMIDGLTGKMES